MAKLIAIATLFLSLISTPSYPVTQSRPAIVRTLRLSLDLTQTPSPLNRILAEKLRPLEGRPLTNNIHKEVQSSVLEAAGKLGWEAKVTFIDGRAVVKAAPKNKRFSYLHPNWIANSELQLVQKVDPLYPPDARRLGIGLSVQIDKQGHVVSAQPSYGPEGLWAAAIKAVRQWAYEPVLQDNQPVDVLTNIVLSFGAN